MTIADSAGPAIAQAEDVPSESVPLLPDGVWAGEECDEETHRKQLAFFRKLKEDDFNPAPGQRHLVLFRTALLGVALYAILEGAPMRPIFVHISRVTGIKARALRSAYNNVITLPIAMAAYMDKMLLGESRPDKAILQPFCYMAEMTFFTRQGRALCSKVLVILSFVTVMSGLLLLALKSISI